VKLGIYMLENSSNYEFAVVMFIKLLWSNFYNEWVEENLERFEN